MYLHNIVGYSIIFNSEPESPAVLLADIPSKYVIGILGTWSNTLERKGDHRRTQWELLDASSVNFPIDQREAIFKRLLEYERKGKQFSIFANRYIVEMIQREYVAFREGDVENVEFDSGDVELRIFKAYCLVIDETTESDNGGLLDTMEEAKKDAELGLHRMVWPYFAKQFEFASGPDYVFEAFKGMALLNFLEKSDKYSKYTKMFFNKFGKQNGVDYLGPMIRMIRDNLLHEDNGRPDDHFIQFEWDSADPWMQQLTVDAEEIASDLKKQRDYIGMKAKPMFRFAKDRYIVPYWKYVYSSLYPGLLFVFHRESGVVNQQDFPGMKQWIGQNFSELFLFRKLMDFSFGNHSIIRYYKDLFNPDCFIRSGRDVFIIEFKDNLMTADVVQSLKFEKFKAAIDKAFIQDPTSNQAKGISQLARVIHELKNLCNTPTVSEDVLPAGMKFENLCIYPIVVYTHFYFDMPGVNDYLCLEFQMRYPELTGNHIMPVTTINLQYFYERFLSFADRQINLKDEIRMYKEFEAKHKLKALKTGEAEDRLASMPSFSEWALANSNSYLDHKREELLNTVMRLLEITE